LCKIFHLIEEKKKKRRRERERREHGEVGEKKLMGLGKKSEVGEKELRCSISLVLHHAGERETHHAGEGEKERARRSGGGGGEIMGLGKKKI
jgi:hypothetical protein